MGVPVAPSSSPPAFEAGVNAETTVVIGSNHTAWEMVEGIKNRCGIQDVGLLVSVTGCATEKMSKDMDEEACKRTFQRWLLRTKAELDGRGMVITTGGTDVGVMKLVGEWVKDLDQSSIHVVGMASCNYLREEKADLEFGHPPKRLTNDEKTRFCEANSLDIKLNGDEVGQRNQIELAIAESTPCVQVVIGGGKKSADILLHPSFYGIPIIVFQGTGRTADCIADKKKEPREDVFEGLPTIEELQQYDRTINKVRGRHPVIFHVGIGTPEELKTVTMSLPGFPSSRLTHAGNIQQEDVSAKSVRDIQKLLVKKFGPSPDFVVSVTGSATYNNDDCKDYKKLQQLLHRGVVSVCHMVNGWMFTGGTTGVMADMGTAVAQWKGCHSELANPPVLVGVSCNKGVEEEQLDGNHSIHLRYGDTLKNDSWGGEINWRYRLEQSFADSSKLVHSVLIVVGGGVGTWKTIKKVFLGNGEGDEDVGETAIVILRGTGRLADELADLDVEKSEYVPREDKKRDLPGKIVNSPRTSIFDLEKEDVSTFVKMMVYVSLYGKPPLRSSNPSLEILEYLTQRKREREEKEKEKEKEKEYPPPKGTIMFTRGKEVVEEAQYVKVVHRSNSPSPFLHSPELVRELVLDAWGLQNPPFIIEVAGCAEELKKGEEDARKFLMNLAKIATRVGAWVVTGASDSGVMKLVGDIFRDVPIIGISKWSRYNFRGGEGDFKVDVGKGKDFLNTGHSHFLLLDDDSTTLPPIKENARLRTPRTDPTDPDILLKERFVEAFMLRKYKGDTRGILVVLGGGPGTYDAVESWAIGLGAPVIAVEGTGRLADSLMKLQTLKAEDLDFKLKAHNDLAALRKFGENNIRTHGQDAKVVDTVAGALGVTSREKVIPVGLDWACGESVGHEPMRVLLTDESKLTDETWRGAMEEAIKNRNEEVVRVLLSELGRISSVDFTSFREIAASKDWLNFDILSMLLAAPSGREGEDLMVVLYKLVESCMELSAGDFEKMFARYFESVDVSGALVKALKIHRKNTLDPTKGLDDGRRIIRCMLSAYTGGDLENLSGKEPTVLHQSIHVYNEVKEEAKKERKRGAFWIADRYERERDFLKQIPGAVVQMMEYVTQEKNKNESNGKPENPSEWWKPLWRLVWSEPREYKDHKHKSIGGMLSKRAKVGRIGIAYTPLEIAVHYGDGDFLIHNLVQSHMRKRMASVRFDVCLHALLYIALLFSLTWVALDTSQGNNPLSYAFRQALASQIEGEEYIWSEGPAHYPLVLDDVSTAEHFWKWVEGPLQGVLTGGDDQHTVGALRVRQLRATSCGVDEIAGKEAVCAFSSSEELMETYGSGGDPFTWKNEDELGLGSWMSLLKLRYPGSGYAFEGDLEGLSKLKDGGWIDRHTRVVFVTFVVYSLPLQLFAPVKVVVEFPGYRVAETSSFIRVVNMHQYMDGLSTQLRWCFGLIAVNLFFALLSWGGTSRQRAGTLWRTLLSAIPPFLFLVLLPVSVVFAGQETGPFGIFLIGLALARLYWVKSARKNMWDLLKVVQTWAILVWVVGEVNLRTMHDWDDPNYEDLADRINTQASILSAVVLLFYLGALKFLSWMHQGIGVLIVTIFRMLGAFVEFLVVAGAVWVAFGLAFHISLGMDIWRYRTAEDSLMSTFLALFGDYEYESVPSRNPVVGHFYLVLHLSLGAILLINLLIAIFNTKYEETQRDARRVHAIETSLAISDLVSLPNLLRPSKVCRCFRTTDNKENSYFKSVYLMKRESREKLRSIVLDKVKPCSGRTE